MKTRIILAMLGLIALVLAGCSALTQAPQVIITNVSPVSAVGDSVTTTIIFKNINKVDAIITTSRISFHHKKFDGADSTNLVWPQFNHSLYVPGDVDSVALTTTIGGLDAVRTSLGTPMTMWMQFSGTDAYGYNKSFNTDSVAINCN